MAKRKGMKKLTVIGPHLGGKAMRKHEAIKKAPARKKV